MKKLSRKKYFVIWPTESCSEPSQTSKMKLFAKTVKSQKPWTNFTKSSILDVWLGFEYASEFYNTIPLRKLHRIIFSHIETTVWNI